jgi:hypothetical protein
MKKYPGIVSNIKCISDIRPHFSAILDGSKIEKIINLYIASEMTDILIFAYLDKSEYNKYKTLYNNTKIKCIQTKTNTVLITELSNFKITCDNNVICWLYNIRIDEIRLGTPIGINSNIFNIIEPKKNGFIYVVAMQFNDPDFKDKIKKHLEL